MRAVAMIWKVDNARCAHARVVTGAALAAAQAMPARTRAAGAAVAPAQLLRLRRVW